MDPRPLSSDTRKMDGKGGIGRNGSATFLFFSVVYSCFIVEWSTMVDYAGEIRAKLQNLSYRRIVGIRNNARTRVCRLVLQ